jgi:hypothetical protein
MIKGRGGEGRGGKGGEGMRWGEPPKTNPVYQHIQLQIMQLQKTLILVELADL